MNREALNELLQLFGFQSITFNLFWTGKTWDDYETFAMTHEPDGWHVFFSERGHRNDERVHNSESDACEDFFMWIAKYPTLRATQ